MCLWVLVVEEPSEQEAWIGHCQDAHLVKDLQIIKKIVFEGTVSKEVPEEGQRLEEEEVHLKDGPVSEDYSGEGED